MLFIEYPKCSTCQRAGKWLEEHGAVFERRHIVEQYELLATDGMLVKRPLLIGEDFAIPGFKEKEWEEKIK